MDISDDETYVKTPAPQFQWTESNPCCGGQPAWFVYMIEKECYESRDTIFELKTHIALLTEWVEKHCNVSPPTDRKTLEKEINDNQ